MKCNRKFLLMQIYIVLTLNNVSSFYIRNQGHLSRKGQMSNIIIFNKALTDLKTFMRKKRCGTSRYPRRDSDQIDDRKLNLNLLYNNGGLFESPQKFDKNVVYAKTNKTSQIIDFENSPLKEIRIYHENKISAKAPNADQCFTLKLQDENDFELKLGDSIIQTKDESPVYVLNEFEKPGEDIISITTDRCSIIIPIEFNMNVDLTTEHKTKNLQEEINDLKGRENEISNKGKGKLLRENKSVGKKVIDCEEVQHESTTDTTIITSGATGLNKTLLNLIKKQSKILEEKYGTFLSCLGLCEESRLL